MPRVNFPRITIPLMGTLRFDGNEENKFRADLERAFEKLPAPSTGGGGGGGGGGDLTAKYLLDESATDLTNGIVIPRGLGPDRVPASPNAMDDEMTDPTTGYNSSLWTIFHSGPTFSFDSKGGLRMALASTNEVTGIDQPFSGSSGTAWGFEMKVVLDSIDGSANSHVGICVRDASTHHIKCFGIGKTGSIAFSGFNFASPLSFSSSFLGSPLGGLQYHSFDYIYLRVHGDGAGQTGMDASFNGVAWFTVAALSNDGFVVTQDHIGIWGYQADHPGSAWIQYFRRYL